MDYRFLLDLAILILSAKALGLVAKRLGAPQVVGEIVAGLLLGPALLNVVQVTDTIEVFSELGVILLMFSAGLGTDLKELIRSGPKALLIATIGVIVPLGGGMLVYFLFNGFSAPPDPGFYSSLFMGTIITATSVSITVAALQEMGKLNTEVGTAIVGAAVIDDVIGIIVLTCVQGAATGSGNIGKVLLMIALFFVCALVVGFLLYKLMCFLDERNPHTQRIPIYSLALCLFLSYAAETWFGIADVTGAYVAGIVLCNIKDASYVERKIDISGYMIFSPIFFACIGLKTNLSKMTPAIILFSVLFILMALITKVIGCGLAAKICRFSWADSLIIGVGMMTRGEVALIVAQKGLDAGVIDPVYFAAVILLIIISSVVTPVILKLLFTPGRKTQAAS
ncbi:MAG: cation:proton antiporter [Lachnospiraceae bacterium]|nr:cation:proton antiporter [Lachnospiraceae bacterium]